ncbi:hypothetical protein BD779DRAFT_1667070 [Infundibulicybe gibba]|nr:hypothetical protein BD779DRAFT_1667070 [Infundibulicybe gibba]
MLHNGSLLSEGSNNDIPEHAVLTSFSPRKGPDPRPTTATSSSPSATSTPSSSTNKTPVIAGALAGGVVVLACVLTITLVHRKQRRKLRALKHEIDPIEDPTGPHILPDPFMAYPQNVHFGPGVPQQNPPGTSVSGQTATELGVPRITITNEDGTTGRPLSLTSNADHRFSRYTDAKPLGLTLTTANPHRSSRTLH